MIAAARVAVVVGLRLSSGCLGLLLSTAHHDDLHVVRAHILARPLSVSPSSSSPSCAPDRLSDPLSLLRGNPAQIRQVSALTAAEAGAWTDWVLCSGACGSRRLQDVIPGLHLMLRTRHRRPAPALFEPNALPSSECDPILNVGLFSLPACHPHQPSPTRTSSAGPVPPFPPTTTPFFAPPAAAAKVIVNPGKPRIRTTTPAATRALALVPPYSTGRPVPLHRQRCSHCWSAVYAPARVGVLVKARLCGGATGVGEPLFVVVFAAEVAGAAAADTVVDGEEATVRPEPEEAEDELDVVLPSARTNIGCGSIGIGMSESEVTPPRYGVAGGVGCGVGPGVGFTTTRRGRAGARGGVEGAETWTCTCGAGEEARAAASRSGSSSEDWTVEPRVPQKQRGWGDDTALTWNRYWQPGSLDQRAEERWMMCGWRGKV
ncbi:hypothetical protein LshimejAT787_2800150 [Lyophyllum shimeji]|uniref:Uncharacterized protein n=1 Tax=Lyophyllum shimeji TaxID=47721 RepID=A0A9P3Q184_LYOSH|nr:hypothetical protein LshimejAT787_2800150 [Lyophyllum shimeji]